MALYNAPVPHTCPMIDEVISALDSVDWTDTYWDKKYLTEIMEKIRNANNSLRSWGNDLCNDLEKLEKQSQSDYIELENKNEDLTSEVEALKSEVLKLKDELSTVSV
jgi:predicted RNase H-like nuclease (RuvC/YqgF family)